MRVIDSHTAGEPTRVVLDGGPDLGSGTLAERAARLEAEHLDFCASVVLEPRGHDAIIGALLVPPSDPACAAGVIYFNNLQNLGMCGHATIGLGVTLAHLGRIRPGRHRFETPVGVVEIDLIDANTVSVVNIESYRLAKDVTVEVEGVGPVTGDVAWGGNWFFLVKNSPIALTGANIRPLTDLTLKIRTALEKAGVTGKDGAWIDHIELFGPAEDPAAQSRNFVLCPGGAYDRSPCGTGCSAKLACLAADGALAPGQDYLQESVIGSTYKISYQPGPGGGVIPTITGQAFVTSDATLIFNPADPYRSGIRL
ncbi:proline racemase, putative [Stappia aggregata IAM 12614]|uniref:4-hydroxyproline 2-epimerase n=1 Tax=Roseibium aggregatum (strain ATCC 25650 / DSM 13394 / JCM 20685 / NBRC 16684 / NCIMB 2208 / IAM 12614 / B1) TaxID=384765 RepID=4HYPE_ROSAI|nr:proline racemase family protein [Roseibium aggregatum]A0NXQ7.1 RecName: Full=4-hydroxyproline 2-epimerase; Short=4Hyp 2-epimerase; Short=4HypE [Roseibium aggregatum IAM 12614]EAV42584.1 proline racemase, putative [Stappia aggregata IAM 12614] [Roseibium aggregatum IAM 12614]